MKSGKIQSSTSCNSLHWFHKSCFLSCSKIGDMYYSGILEIKNIFNLNSQDMVISVSHVTLFCIIPILCSVHLLISQRTSMKLSYTGQTVAARVQYREIMWNTRVSLIPVPLDPFSLLGLETERMRRAFDCLRSLAYCKLTTGSYGTQGNLPFASVTSSTSHVPLGYVP